MYNSPTSAKQKTKLAYKYSYKQLMHKERVFMLFRHSLVSSRFNNVRDHVGKRHSDKNDYISV